MITKNKTCCRCNKKLSKTELKDLIMFTNCKLMPTNVLICNQCFNRKLKNDS